MNRYTGVNWSTTTNLCFSCNIKICQTAVRIIDVLNVIIGDGAYKFYQSNVLSAKQNVPIFINVCEICL